MTTIDLCCGHGGTALGFAQAGFTCLAAVDNDEQALTWFSKNHPRVPTHKLDLGKVTKEELLELGSPDVMIITAPCQGISTAGKFDPYHPLNRLLLRCIQMVGVYRPKHFVIENVEGLVAGRMRDFYSLVRTELLKLEGYEFVDGVLNAFEFGVPQSRKRWICIGSRETVPTLPSPVARRKVIKDVCPHLEKIVGGYLKDGKHPMVRYGFEPSFTITATVNAFLPDGRPLRIEDVQALCGFPSSYQHDSSHAKAWKRYGNSVLPPFAEALARHIAGFEARNILKVSQELTGPSI